jgi:hypothetical protein
MQLAAKPKRLLEDQELAADAENEDFTQHILTRFFAVKRTFKRVQFTQAVLSNCYFRNCTFIECDFTGAVIKECNLRGAKFENCNFRYATLEKTQIDPEVMRNGLPTGENLARDFVRSLRVNFSQIGDYVAVNEAIRIEVRLTREHYYNAAYSRTAYYRTKYKGRSRLAHGLYHAKWTVLDWLWGNGESALRIILTGLFLIACVAIMHPRAIGISGYFHALPYVIANFWGVKTSEDLSPEWFTAVTIGRFVLFALFIAVLVKRFARR